MEDNLQKRVLNALRAIGKPSTAKEVFNYMVENKIDVGTSQTPADSVSASLVGHHKANRVIYTKRPKGAGLYGFAEWSNIASSNHEVARESATTTEKHKNNLLERSLHQLLCNYLYTRSEYPKTIFQEQSNKNDANQKWIHPDIISASFVNTTTDATGNLLKIIKTDEAIQLFSYELKIHIRTDYELKQAYFQALSNSNWANYGYLVAFDISDKEEMLMEMERLNQSFGIGIIHLGVTPESTNILYPARKKELDYKTIDKLCAVNMPFKDFIESATLVLAADKKYEQSTMDAFCKICDKRIEKIEKIKDYCKEHKIPWK